MLGNKVWGEIMLGKKFGGNSAGKNSLRENNARKKVWGNIMLGKIDFGEKIMFVKIVRGKIIFVKNSLG